MKKKKCLSCQDLTAFVLKLKCGDKRRQKDKSHIRDISIQNVEVNGGDDDVEVEGEDG